MQGFDLIVLGVFCGKKGKANFGSGDEARFLQSSGRGKIGSSFDALD